MCNKPKLFLIYILKIFSIIYLICIVLSIIIESIFSIKNEFFIIFLRDGGLFHAFRIIIPILIIFFTFFMEKKRKAENIANIKILNVLFYIINTISILLIGLTLNYILTNPDFISEIQKIPFGRIHDILIIVYTILTVPLIGMVIAFSILLLNYRINKYARNT